MPAEQMTSANKPLSADGRTYHVEVREGEVANRIVTVGDAKRARTLAQHLDRVLFERESHRGFVTITGVYRGLPVSIVAIGMGPPMVDFFVRETRMVVRGPMSIVRFGSCGSICDATTGDVIVATGAFAITRNFKFFSKEADRPYILWPAVASDPQLTRAVTANLARPLGAAHVYSGLVGNADSFYSSQGRTGSDFYDANGDLIDTVHATYSDAVALEMECHMLLHLAQTSTGADGTSPASIRAACALMVFADRAGNSFISPETSERMVQAGARAVLDALVEEMPSQDGLHPAAGSVWEGELGA
ncbi:hypothetical protein IWQ57_002704 [Coemansia nantahalensis]|uniref:Uncharacterized protein n=2 Tax=Coemansia TaxID=4863 RepID=A0ACC1LF29_9FUNG|nr:hypothetical protein IWQ57_002704 [Coemansia nantahalensis]KAJ2806266.1 hypothetical protein H4R21_000942 [Coemansia helicoidea]